MGSNYDDDLGKVEKEILELSVCKTELPKKNGNSGNSGNSEQTLRADITEIQVLQRETILDIGKICTRLDTLTSAVQGMEKQTEKIDKNVTELKEILKDLALNIYTR